MDDVDLLASVPLLSGLTPAALARIASGLTVRRIEAGDTLLRQGEPGDALYIVRHGRLEVEVDGTVLRTLSSGSALGEQALLGGGVRTATVRAARDCELLELDRASFEQVLAGEPAFALALLRELSLRLPRSDQPPPRPSAAVISVVASHAGTPVEVGRRLADALARWGPTTTLDAGSASADSWASTLDAAERVNRWTVLIAPAPDDDWARFCLRQADRVLVVVDPRKKPSTPAVRDADLVFTGRTGVGAWLDAWTPRAHHFAADVPCIARRVAGRSVGAVLSGGGARGFAHLGALAVLEERGITVDRVGGTSMGAYVAALHATGRSVDEITDVVRRELVERSPFRDYTWPRHGLIRARRAAAMLDRVFGAEMIEDQSRGLYCVSVDLVAAEEVVHRRGRIAEAVGRSMSLPGVAPPIRADRRLHVDGGVLNNLPVDVMATDGEGPIIAVDVMRPFGGPPHGLPGLVDTISRSMVLGSWRKVEANRALANVLIAPRLDEIQMFDFGRLDEIVRHGRLAAEQALDENPLNVHG